MKHFQACVEAPSGSLSVWRFSADDIEEAVKLIKTRYGRGDNDSRVLFNCRVSIIEVHYDPSKAFERFHTTTIDRKIMDAAAKSPRAKESGWELPPPFPTDGF